MAFMPITASVCSEPIIFSFSKNGNYYFSITIIEKVKRAHKLGNFLNIFASFRTEEEAIETAKIFTVGSLFTFLLQISSFKNENKPSGFKMKFKIVEYSQIKIPSKE